MPEKTRKMVCPECGVEMNQHAEKLVDPRNAQEAARVDPALGGLIDEMHSCPKCGKVETRRVN